MNEELAIEPVRKSGLERFREGQSDLGFDLLSFWQWAGSDLVMNTARGVLAEYLVARAVGARRDDVRDGWAAYDLSTPSGTKLQVKSCAYLQSWPQKRASPIVFSIRPTRAWDPKTGELAAEPTLEADVYVFALLAHEDKKTLDPMDVAQWRFYVASRTSIESHFPSEGSITLASLERQGIVEVPYSRLGDEVEGHTPPGPKDQVG